MVRGIIFDKDGTLTDFQATWEVGARIVFDALAGDDTDLKRAMGSAVGFDWDNGTFRPGSVGVTGPESAVLDALERVLVNADRSWLDDTYFSASAEVIQAPAVELVPLFDRLSKAGLVLGIVTNDTESSARALTAEFGLDDFLAFVSGSDSGHGSKPSPGQLLAFCDAANLPPSEILMVGDSHFDLEAADAAGMRSIGVLTGAATTADLEPWAEAVLPDIGHLPRWLALN